MELNCRRCDNLWPHRRASFTAKDSVDHFLRLSRAVVGGSDALLVYAPNGDAASTVEPLVRFTAFFHGYRTLDARPSAYKLSHLRL